MKEPGLHPLLHHLTEHAGTHAFFALALSVFVSAIAYLHRPRVKALVYSLPVPVSFGYLAMGLPINATHLTGLALVVGYSWLVYGLHRKLRVPLAATIPLAAGTYVLGGLALVPLRVWSPWWVVGPIVLAWAVVVRLYRPRAEAGHRSTMPWFIKAPIVWTIGMTLYSVSGLLAGATTTFPFAGVFTSYEARHSLRTLAGQFTINSLGLVLMLLAMHVQERAGVPFPWPLLGGWVVVVSWVALVYRLHWGRPESGAPE